MERLDTTHLLEEEVAKPSQVKCKKCSNLCDEIHGLQYQKADLKVKLSEALKANRSWEASSHEIQLEKDQILAIKLQLNIYSNEIVNLQKEKTALTEKYEDTLHKSWRIVDICMKANEIYTDLIKNEAISLYKNPKLSCPCCSADVDIFHLHSHLIACFEEISSPEMKAARTAAASSHVCC